MRMLIASDLHGSLSSLRFLHGRIAACAPDMVVLLGDLVYHGPRNPLPAGYNTQGLLGAMSDLNRLVTAVRGNCDAEVDMDLLPFPMPENAWIDADYLRIFACHGHHLPTNPPFANIPPGSVILRGHTHVPRGETINGFHIWNPGSLSLPKQGFPRSYAIYENGVFTVLDMDGGEILRHCPQDN